MDETGVLMDIEQLLKYADSLSVIVIVLYMWSREAKRADRLEAKLITTLEIKDRESATE